MIATGWETILNALSRDIVSEVVITGRNAVWAKVNGETQRVKHVAWNSLDDFYEDFRSAAFPSIRHEGFKFPRDERGIFEGALVFTRNVQTQHDGVRNVEIHARLHMMLPPSCEFPQVTIAKRSEALTTLESMTRNGTMNMDILDFLKRAVSTRQTIVFSAGGGAGKTTMLRACCNYIGMNERVIVCEDTPELSLPQENVSYLLSQPWRPGMDPNNVISLEYLVAQANRMRPDRIIVGETRSKEFHGFLHAASSGYEGSMTTLHADSPKECLTTMAVLDAAAEPNLEVGEINNEIAHSVDFIVQLAKDERGKHWVDEIMEVSDTVSDTTNRISTATVFKRSRGGFSNMIRNLSDFKRNELGYKATDISASHRSMGF